jgi:hypothetical protein
MKNSLGKYIFGFLLALILVAVSAQVLAAAVTEKKSREYAGGADEEDLKVQTELPAPPVKVDRKSVEQKALQGFLKKTGGSKAPAGTAKDEQQ